GGKIDAIQFEFRHLPVRVSIERGNAKRQPAHGPVCRDQYSQIAAITAGDDRNGLRVDTGMAREQIICRTNIGKIIFTCHGLQLVRCPAMAAHVESEADTTKLRELARAPAIALLASCPAVDEQYSRK